VAAFYDAVTDAFSALFDGSVHAGYCARGAATIIEAQAHLNAEVLQACSLRPGIRVLDLGCGTGGPAIQAARDHGVRVSGVTLSPKQAAAATAAAQQAGLGSSIDFAVADMASMPFADASFDAAFSIESLLFHVEDKDAALAEIARVLRPRATLVVADYALANPMSPEDMQIAKDAMICAVPLATAAEARDAVSRAGFDQVELRRLTDDVRPSGALMRTAVTQRRQELVAAAGEEGYAGTQQAAALYTGMFVEGQDYLLLRALRAA
jgi:27-O-demethylrifamycin SV methyltransferase